MTTEATNRKGPQMPANVRIVAILVTLAAVLMVASPLVAAKPINFCDQKPTHPRCLTATPTAAPTSTAVPTATPTPTAVSSATPIVTPSPVPTATPTPSGQPNPLTCAGYPEPRTFLEVQSWWGEPGIAEPMHLHAGTCFPLGQNMSGTSVFDVRVMLHRNPGTLFALSFDFYNGQSQYINVPDVTCALDCTYWYRVTVNWSNSAAGWQELRLKPRVMLPPEFDTDPGATMITSSGWPVQVRGGTGGARSSCQTNKTTCYTESRGWYEHRGYQNVQVNNLNLLIGPGNVWSGIKSIPVKMNCGCGGEDTPTTHWAAYVDPDIHNGSFGTLIASGTGSFSDNLSIDTTQFTNGPHRLVLRTGSNQPAHATPGSLDGIGVYSFVVSNP